MPFGQAMRARPPVALARTGHFLGVIGDVAVYCTALSRPRSPRTAPPMYWVTTDPLPPTLHDASPLKDC